MRYKASNKNGSILFNKPINQLTKTQLNFIHFLELQDSIDELDEKPDDYTRSNYYLLNEWIKKYNYKLKHPQDSSKHQEHIEFKEL